METPGNGSPVLSSCTYPAIVAAAVLVSAPFIPISYNLFSNEAVAVFLLLTVRSISAVLLMLESAVVFVFPKNQLADQYVSFCL